MLAIINGFGKLGKLLFSKLGFLTESTKKVTFFRSIIIWSPGLDHLHRMLAIPIIGVFVNLPPS